MPKKNIIVVNVNPYFVDSINQLKKKYNLLFIDQPDELTHDNINKHQPEWVFFAHWSEKVDQAIFNKFNCVVFHMTDLPYGRGGSPLQNLIVRGFSNTKISAIKMEEELDSGDVFLKKDLSLDGAAKDIFKRAGEVIAIMIEELVDAGNLQASPQSGEVVKFARRKPEDGDLSKLKSIDKVYDYIRMLDAEGYPNAFIETEYFKFEFSSIKNLKEGLEAHVRIIQK